MIEVLIALFGGMALLCKAAFGWIEPIRRENRQQKEEEERWKRLFDAECEYYAQYGGIENHSKALVATELDWEMIHITNLEDYLKPDLIAIFGEENWKEIVERDEWWISEEKKNRLNQCSKHWRYPK